MSKTTILASGRITRTDVLLVQLQEPDDLPATVLIIWPLAPSVIDPRRFGATANAVARHGCGHHNVGSDPSKQALKPKRQQLPSPR